MVVVFESFVEIRCCVAAAAALRVPSLLWPLSAPRPSVSPSVVEEFCRRFVLCGGTKGHNVESGRSVVRSV